MKIRLIHGIHSPEGDNNMSHFAGPMLDALPRATVLLYQYGFLGFWAARWRNDGIAKLFAQETILQRDPAEVEVWITHSNGAAIAYLAVEKYGAQPDMIININPALDRWRTPSVPHVDVIHSNGDRWVYLSQFLPGHIWGDQGRVGYRGPLLNTKNHNASNFGPAMRYEDHIGAFTRERIGRWALFCAGRIKSFAEGRLE